MRRFWCRLFGHSWQWRWWDMSKKDSHVCLRCGIRQQEEE